VLLQQAGVTNIQLLQAARALNGAPTDPDAKRSLSAAANAVIESMKNLLLATNALQVWPTHTHPAASAKKKVRSPVAPTPSMVPLAP